jgi:hypothetical protein
LARVRRHDEDVAAGTADERDARGHGGLGQRIGRVRATERQRRGTTRDAAQYGSTIEASGLVPHTF